MSIDVPMRLRERVDIGLADGFKWVLIIDADKKFEEGLRHVEVEVAKVVVQANECRCDWLDHPYKYEPVQG